MSVSHETKLLWFDRGAAAFERDFPGVLESYLPDAPPMYVCPICTKAQSREAVAAGLLTAEHVPPESFCGRELLLTCRACNNEAGFGMDAEALKAERPKDAMAGRPGRYHVRVKIDGQAFRTPIDIDGRKIFFPPLVREERLNRPGTRDGVIGRFKDKLRAGERPPINLNFYADAHSAPKARVSWLRSAYLAVFSGLGYRFMYNPALGVVREQIRAPNKEIIPTFMLGLNSEHDRSLRQVIIVKDPSRCLAVQMGSRLVLLPEADDTTFYDRLAEKPAAAADPVKLHGAVGGWPSRPPTFGHRWAASTLETTGGVSTPRED